MDAAEYFMPGFRAKSYSPQQDQGGFWVGVRNEARERHQAGGGKTAARGDKAKPRRKRKKGDKVAAKSPEFQAAVADFAKFSQLVSNQLDTKLRDDLERLKKMRNHRGLRHYWGIRVRGQHTKTTGRGRR